MVTAFLGWAVALSAGPPADVPDVGTPAERRAALFASGRVLRLDLTVDKKGMQSLRGQPREAVPASVREGRRVYADVAVHLRGAVGSFRPVDDKPGLTFSMTKLGANGTFHGMTKFHLVNCNQDGTYVQELLCGEMFRAAGVPAARLGHAVVTLNGRPLGLYALKEGYDKGFLREHFKSPNGNLYDGGFITDIDRPLHRMSGGDGDGDHAELKALAAAAREPDHAKRLDKLDKLLEMDKFLALLAVDTYMSDWDGYPAKANNYRVYHDPKTGKITFIPSGMDQMFGDPNYDLFAFGGLVARSVVETKKGRAMYLAKLREVLDKVAKPDDIRARLKALAAVVGPALLAVDRGAGQNYPNVVRDFADRVANRTKAIRDQLRRAERQK